VALVCEVDVLLTIAACGILGILFFVDLRKVRARHSAFIPWLFAPWFVPSALAIQNDNGAGTVLRRALELFGVFLKIGTIIWGGGFAAIPFIRNEVVEVRPWLTPREFIDGVALGQITPGPVAITATFVGYRVLGLVGAFLASVGMFLPSFIILLVLLHFYDRIRDHYLVKGFLQGIMPAVVGMLLSAALFIGRESITGVPAGLLALASLALLLFTRVDPVWLVLGGGAVGLVLLR
jgi:chromate transporter